MYEVEFRPQATQDFEKLDRAVADRLLKKLRWLAQNFDSIKPESLTGPFAHLFKLRVGNYRVIYEINFQKKALVVRIIGHRREVYDQP